MQHLPDYEPGLPAKSEPDRDESHLGAVREALQVICNHLDLTPYEVAEAIYQAKVDHLKQIGELRRVTDITSEEEQDDHFDELSRLFRQTCLSLGLAWPPPVIDDRPDR